MGLLGSGVGVPGNARRGAFADLAVEAGDGFGVVIQDIRFGGQDWRRELPNFREVWD